MSHSTIDVQNTRAQLMKLIESFPNHAPPKLSIWLGKIGLQNLSSSLRAILMQDLVSLGITHQTLSEKETKRLGSGNGNAIHEQTYTHEICQMWSGFFQLITQLEKETTPITSAVLSLIFQDPTSKLTSPAYGRVALQNAPSVAILYTIMNRLQFGLERDSCWLEEQTYETEETAQVKQFLMTAIRAYDLCLNLYRVLMATYEATFPGYQAQREQVRRHRGRQRPPMPFLPRAFKSLNVKDERTDFKKLIHDAEATLVPNAMSTQLTKVRLMYTKSLESAEAGEIKADEIEGDEVEEDEAEAESESPAKSSAPPSPSSYREALQKSFGTVKQVAQRTTMRQSFEALRQSAHQTSLLPAPISEESYPVAPEGYSDELLTFTVAFADSEGNVSWRTLQGYAKAPSGVSPVFDRPAIEVVEPARPVELSPATSAPAVKVPPTGTVEV